MKLLSQDSSISNRIKYLDNRLANQIAAGEVVERPASVVKELLENSIDAGANKIEVDIERGGTRLIRVTDNGSGIVKEDLSLALSRHATSKISTSKDLAAINSLGFRGEALASIGSVSRLCLTSRTKDSDSAWQAIAEGRDMQVDVQPASAIVGTRIEVRDLFYNTPARQKFLRAEKTEFGHIEEIFKRHALANFEIAFILKHNHKVVKRIPASRDRNDYLKRIESICGRAFAENAIAFMCEHDAIKIQGWLGGIDFHRSESDIQYVFINGRPVKDKMLNHALRQSYQGLLPPGRMPTFVVFLQIDPGKIDVNVHPTKHEVRFDEQRMVHDLLVKSIGDALTDDENLELSYDTTQGEKREESNDYPLPISERSREVGVGYSHASYQTKNNWRPFNSNEGGVNKVKSIGERPPSLYPVDPLQYENTPHNKIRLANGIWIVLLQDSAFLIDEEKYLSDYLASLMRVESTSEELNLQSKPLLFPQKIKLDTSHLEAFETLNKLQKMGFVFESVDSEHILLQQIPNWLASVDKQIIFNHFSDWVGAFSDENVNVGLRKIYQRLEKLSEELFDYLLLHHVLIKENAPLDKNSAVRKITAEVAAKLFMSEPFTSEQSE